jgi:cold shock CspA family protein
VDKLEGIVKFYKKDVGWGFITHDGVDYYVHASNLLMDKKTLYHGEKVVFHSIKTSKGLMAIDVERSI